jgi:hypothetical protein
VCSLDFTKEKGPLPGEEGFADNKYSEPNFNKSLVYASISMPQLWVIVLSEIQLICPGNIARENSNYHIPALIFIQCNISITSNSNLCSHLDNNFPYFSCSYTVVICRNQLVL